MDERVSLQTTDDLPYAAGLWVAIYVLRADYAEWPLALAGCCCVALALLAGEIGRSTITKRRALRRGPDSVTSRRG